MTRMITEDNIDSPDSHSLTRGEDGSYDITVPSHDA